MQSSDKFSTEVFATRVSFVGLGVIDDEIPPCLHAMLGTFDTL